jgi:hypothetical protein
MKTMSKLALGLLASMTVTAAMAQAPQVKQEPPVPQVAPAGKPEKALKELTRGDVLAKASQRFDAVDTNNDGKLSVEEQKAAHQKFREMRQKHRHQGQRGDRQGPPPDAKLAPPHDGPSHTADLKGPPPPHGGMPGPRPVPPQGAQR